MAVGRRNDFQLAAAYLYHSRMDLMSLSCALKMVEMVILVLCVFHCNFYK